MAVTKQQHLDATRTPKRILALDGGGIRGILTLQYLEKIEQLLRDRTGNPKLLLCDYFDLIGGTSTGSIIAAGLACGMSVAELQTLYRQIGSTIFETGIWDKLRGAGVLGPKFPAEPVKKALVAQLGADTTLGSDQIRTGLMIMTKRLDTGSPWPLHNHPNARYAQHDGALRLVDVVRASTAAPTYFEPEVLKIHSENGTTVDGAFVDGGVSPFNDPALQLLMVAALQGHGFRWQTGADKLLVISVGTGTYKQTYETADLVGSLAAKQGIQALQSLMDDCGRMNHVMMQWLTKCLTPWFIERAVEDMKLDSEKGPQLATYARYNVLLDQKWLKTNVEIDYGAKQVVSIAAMDNPNNMDELTKIGRLAATKQILPEHFPAAFDLKASTAAAGA